MIGDPKFNTRDAHFGGREDSDGPLASQQILFQKVLRESGERLMVDDNMD